MSSPVPAGVAFHATLCATARTNVVTTRTSWSVRRPPVAPVSSSVETHPVSHAAGCATTTWTARQETTPWNDAHTHTPKGTSSENKWLRGRLHSFTITAWWRKWEGNCCVIKIADLAWLNVDGNNGWHNLCGMVWKWMSQSKCDAPSKWWKWTRGE